MSMLVLSQTCNSVNGQNQISLRSVATLCMKAGLGLKKEEDEFDIYFKNQALLDFMNTLKIRQKLS